MNKKIAILALFTLPFLACDVRFPEKEGDEKENLPPQKRGDIEQLKVELYLVVERLFQSQRKVRDEMKAQKGKMDPAHFSGRLMNIRSTFRKKISEILEGLKQLGCSAEEANNWHALAAENYARKYNLTVEGQERGPKN